MLNGIYLIKTEHVSNQKRGTVLLSYRVIQIILTNKIIIVSLHFAFGGISLHRLQTLEERGEYYNRLLCRKGIMKQI